ncbi:MAG TPA: putative nucleotidyltransferase substrate binding domain-containing protein [Pseudonocardia sp.]|nr:putative nucleotidyltransferase substrate binding domain-containing protein [Pseudonocardia sp.]
MPEYRELADFLGSQAPYDSLDASDLQALAEHVEVQRVAAGTVVVIAEGAVLEHLYVVRHGAVQVLDRGRVIDELGEGDTFGHISVFSGLPPPLAVRAAEDTVLYRLPDPRGLLRHPERLRFNRYGALPARTRVTRDGVFGADQRPVREYLRPAVFCPPTATVREAAARITGEYQSCALLDTPGGLGIVTDSDFRRGLAEGLASFDAPVTTLATIPARTIPVDTSRAQAFINMVEHGVHHLIALDDRARPVGIVRAMDLASADVRDPLLIRAAIETATDLEQLVDAAALLPSTAVELIDAGLPPVRVGALLAAVREALLRKLVALDGELAGGPGCAWFVLGSTARHEPLPSSDLDTALAWREPGNGDTSGSDPAGALLGEQRAKECRAAAERVLTNLGRCGIQRCPDGLNATNPLFSRSVRGWTEAAAAWQRDPSIDQALLLTAMVADSRPVTELAVGRAVVDATRTTTPSRHYLTMMLRFTVAVKPPLGFVRNFVVEHTGEHRGQLNLKRGGLMPIASIGRWVAVLTGDPIGSTPERLRRGLEAKILTQNEVDSLVGAFELIYELLLERESAALRAGTTPSRHLNPGELDSLTRRHLRAAFREVHRVQSRLDADWVSWLP